MDFTTLGPTIGVGALLLYMLQFLWRETGDRRRYEAQQRKEFAEERAALRKECADERRGDRDRIAALEVEVSRLRDQLDAGRR